MEQREKEEDEKEEEEEEEEDSFKTCVLFFCQTPQEVKRSSELFAFFHVRV
jgi:hypothetical protein